MHKLSNSFPIFGKTCMTKQTATFKYVSSKKIMCNSQHSFITTGSDVIFFSSLEAFLVSSEACRLQTLSEEPSTLRCYMVIIRSTLFITIRGVRLSPRQPCRVFLRKFRKSKRDTRVCSMTILVHIYIYSTENLRRTSQNYCSENIKY